MELHGKPITITDTPTGKQYGYFASDADFPYVNFDSNEECDDSVSKFLYILNWEYDAYVTSIGVDMWMGFTVKYHNYDMQLYIQCDTFEAGIMAAVEICAMLRKEGVLPE